MKSRSRGTLTPLASALVLLFLLSVSAVHGQTYLRVSDITPGTENVQLVYNGDFSFQGIASAGTHPLPDGWTRQASVFADAGANMVSANQGVVARATVETAASVGMYRKTVRLEPNTDYVLSAYLWNFGDANNRVRTMVDLNDAPQEGQLSVSWSQPDADKGYFAYSQFNTANTGTNITLRVFYDGFTGTGAAANWFPLAAQWDNIAITRAEAFVPPQAAGTGGNLRPAVRIVRPVEGEYLALGAGGSNPEIAADASDPDGTISTVEFFSGATRIGQTSASPYTITPTNLPAGWNTLTVVATDNAGARTLSAPVRVQVSSPPVPAALNVTRSADGIALSWPTSATSVSLLSSTSMVSVGRWPAFTNSASVSNGLNYLTVSISNSAPQRYFGLGDTVDPSTLNRKLMMGYQGWFACPGDGSAVNRWVHWFRSNSPVATNSTVDFWPDLSEFEPDELFETSMTMRNGSPAKLYSAHTQKTVVRHFRWMKDNGLDGVFLQRFSSELSSSSFSALRNQVALNVRVGAETYGRVFAIMYDISGQSAATLASTLTNDWAFLNNTLHLTESPAYVRHKGKPVVAIWGFGFTDRPGTPAEALAVINYFKSAGAIVMGGVPTYWRTLKSDSQTDPAWAAVYRAFDIVSPWAVGRYGTTTEADTFKVNLIAPDLAETKRVGIDYMPVVFPGFSWHNLNAGALNQIPRRGGSFYWRQVYNAISAGCTMIYGAMFDEVDEGTAMYKLAPTTADLPA